MSREVPGRSSVRRVLAVGDRVPDVAVWTAPREHRQISELVSEGTTLFLFYLFDWSST
jgi:hypothetical protein